MKRKATTVAHTGGHIAPAAMSKGGVMWIGAIFGGLCYKTRPSVMNHRWTEYVFENEQPILRMAILRAHLIHVEMV